MGSMDSAVSTALNSYNSVKTMMNTVNAVTGMTQKRKDESALAQLRQRQLLYEKQEASQIAAEKQQRALETASVEEERKTTLKRSLAKQRAAYGGQGVSSTGGSSDAVLSGLYEESDAERKRREQLNAVKNRALDSDLENLRKQNLLEYQQTAEKQKLARLV